MNDRLPAAVFEIAEDSVNGHVLPHAEDAGGPALSQEFQGLLAAAPTGYGAWRCASRPRAIWVAAAAAAALLAVPALAQDPDLDPLQLREIEPTAGLEASSLQFVRLPLGFSVRDPVDRKWGLEITLPVSFGIYELTAVGDLGDLTERLEALTVTPGLELSFPAGSRWMIKPFAEIGLGADLRREATELLFSFGLRTRGDYDLSWGHLTVGFG